MIVKAKTNPEAGYKRISCFLLKNDIPGLIVGHEKDKMGLRASDTIDLIFENCRVPASSMLGKEGDGFMIAMNGLDDGRIEIASQCIGVAKAAFDASIKYSKQKKQCRKSISKFQGIRWIIADMATQIEAEKQLLLLLQQ